MSQYKQQTVDQWLDSVDYQALNAYVPSAFALEFINFIKLVNGTEGEENISPVFHYKMVDQLGNRERRIANLCFRGSGKSTVAEYLFLYLAVFNSIPGFGAVPLGLYISDSIDNGIKSMRENLEYRLENSDFLKLWIKDYTFTQARWVFMNHEDKPTIIKGYGAQSGIRGVKELGQRPMLAIIDDILSDEDARSKAVIAKVTATVNKAIKYALHPTRQKVIWNGTPFNKEDPLYRAIESGGWNVNVYPICQKFPCSREEFIGAWPDRFTFDYVSQQYTDATDDGDASGFYQELMLRLMGNEQRLVNVNTIVRFPLTKVIDNKHSFNFYITTDFATSEKTGADFSVIGVWAYTNNGEFLLVDGICRRQTMDKNINDLFRLCQKWKPDSVGVEVSGQQGGFVSWIYDQMMTRNIYFTLATSNNNGTPGIRPVRDKHQRFNVVVPWFNQQKFWIANELKGTELEKELIEELSYATPTGFLAKKDDCIDMVSMLSEMPVWKPSLELTKLGDEQDIWGDDMIDEGDMTFSSSSYVV